MSIQEPSPIKPDTAEKSAAKNRTATDSWWRFFLRLFAMIVAFIFVLMAWVMWTNTGTRVFFASVQGLSDGRVEAKEIQGRLADHLELGELKLKFSDTHVALYGLRLDWQSQALLGGSVRVDALAASRVAITHKANEKAATLPTSLALPVELHIKQLLLGRLEFTSVAKLAGFAESEQGKPQWSINGVVAGLESDQKRHQWRLQLQSVWGSVQSEGEVLTAAPFPVKASYHYAGQLIADLPQVSVKGSVSGDLSRLRVQADSPHQNGQPNAAASAPAEANQLTAQLAAELSPFTEQALSSGQLHIKNLNPRWLNASAPRAMLDIDLDVRPVPTVKPAPDNQQVDGRSLKLHLPKLQKKQDDPVVNRDAATLMATVSVKNAAPASLDQEGLPFKQFSAEAQWIGRALKVTHARLSLLEGQIEGQAQSDFSVLAQAQLNAKLSVKDLNLAHIDSRLHPSAIKGQIQVQTKEHGKAQRQIDFQAQLIDPLANLQAEASLLLGDTTQLQLKSVELSSEQSQLKAQAEMTWGAQHEFKMQGKLTQFDPSRWMKAPKGHLDGEFVAAGSWQPEWQIRLSVPHLGGELGGQALNGLAQLQWQGDRSLKIDQMQWQWGRNTLQANGSLGADKDELRLSLAADDLSSLNAISPRHLLGRANMLATLRGKLMTPSVEAQVQAEDVQWGTVAKLAYLKASASMGAGQQAAMNVQVQAQQLRWNIDEGAGAARATNAVREFSASLQGTRAAHRLVMQTQWDGGQTLTVNANGKFDLPDWSAPAWNGSLDALQLSGLTTSSGGELAAANFDLALREPSRLHWSRDKLLVSQLNLQGRLGQIDVDQFEWTPRTVSTVGRARAFPASVLMKLSKAKERVQGDLTLAFDWDVQLKEHLAAKIAVHRQTGDIEVVDAEATGQRLAMGIREFDLDLRSAGLVAGSDAEKIELSLNAKGSRLGNWNAKLNSQLRRDGVHWTWDTEMPLAGNLQVQINDLQWLASQASSELVGKGQLKMDANFSGKFSHPIYQAKIEGHGLEFAFASEGMLFPNGELKALLTDEVFKLEQLRFTNTLAFVPKIERFQDLNWAGRVGEFEASGEVSWRLQQGAITANWKNFPLLQRKDRWLVVSGQAGIQQSDQSWTLAGKLAADAAYFRLPKMPPPSLSNDVLISRELKLTAGDEEAATKFATKAKFDLQLDMGSRFVFVGRGLDTALSGVMRLRGSESSPVYASGSIATKGGQYEGYGQQLEIERGILKFQGSAFNPALNIRALRKGLPVEAGVDVTGTVANPQVRLVSEPNVPDNEKVSWLVLGRGLDQFATADASLLLSAAGAIFGGDGSRNIPRELAQGLGFDEFSIGPAESGGTSKLPNQTIAGAISAGATANDQVVSIGKRFKPGIVLSVERGVSDASNALKLSWQLGRRIRLVGRKGTDDAVDVKYSFSFN